MSTSLHSVDIPKRYQIHCKIGEGGMGQVFLAADQELAGDLVAIKTLKKSNLEKLSEEHKAKAVGRFLFEQEVMIRIESLYVPKILRRDRYFFVMPYIRGLTLKDDPRSASEQPSVRLAPVLESMRDVARAVYPAHQLGIIHRDLKPANVMLSEEKKAVTLDWGLAIQMADCSQSEKLRLGQFRFETFKAGSGTLDGAIAGTPEYLSPEMAVGDLASVCPQTDIFGYNAMLYEALMGFPPNKNGPGKIERPPIDAPRDFNRKQQLLYPALRKEIETGLDVNPKNRHSSFEELCKRLEPFVWEFVTTHQAHTPQPATLSFAEAASKKLINLSAAATKLVHRIPSAA